VTALEDRQERPEGTIEQTRDSVDSAGSLPSPFSDGGLTVLLPVHNEAQTIERVLAGFWEVVVGPTSAKVLICEDGSTDGTGEVLRRLAGRYPLRFENGTGRKGYAGAVRDGLLHVDTSTVFFADSDGQYYPEDFWKLWPHLKEYDMVIGRKVNRDEPAHRLILSWGFHLLAKIMTGVPLRDMDCGFRVLRRDVVERILPEVGSLPYSFWAEFTILAYQRGIRILEVPVSHRARFSGSTSIYQWDRIPKIVRSQFRGLTDLARRLRG
jgi:glycosyltransferase involved in cell wall biosynthesis